MFKRFFWQIILVMMFTSFNYPAKAGELEWSKLPSSQNGRYNPIVLLDKKNNRILVWRGIYINQRFSQYIEDLTLESLDLTTETWTFLKTSGDKPPSGKFFQGSCAILDSLRNRIIVFGGYTTDDWDTRGQYPGVYYNNLWILDLTNLVWSKITPSGTWPCPRAGSAAINDGSRMIVFGGSSGWKWGGIINFRSKIYPYHCHNDLWALDLTTLKWSWLKPSGGSLPSHRDRSAAIYDAKNNRMIIFGGQNENRLNESYCVEDLLWLFDFSSLTWTQLQPSGESPSRRFSAEAVYDNIGNMILFGGKCSPEPWWWTDFFSGNDCYSLNLLPGKESWTKLPFKNSPSARYGHKMVFDPGKQQIILFGGLEECKGLGYFVSSSNEAWAFKKIATSISLSNLQLTYDGKPKQATVNIYPEGLNISVTYNGSRELPVDVGSYLVIAEYPGDATHSPAYAEDVLIIKKIATSISLSDLAYVYDGKPKQANVNIYPEGLNISVTYNGSRELPIDVGSYLVIAEYPGDATHESSYAKAILTIAARPKNFVLYQNYPNPFNLTTIIKYELPKEASVTLKIFNVLGQEVATLLDNEYQELGYYKISWNTAGYPSGVYFYQIKTGKFQEIRKMILLK